MPNETEPSALRVVFLLGGLQAEDFEQENVDIGVDGVPALLRFKRPPYRDLYAHLERRGLQPVGVRIIVDKADAEGLNPADWHTWNTPEGLRSLHIIHDWSNVRRSKAALSDEAVGELAQRIRAYLRLTDFRLFQLAKAYHDMLRMKLVAQGIPADGTLFSNLWGVQVDAAIHAFLADAASLRDALAEATWRLVLKNADGQVRVMASFIKQARNTTHPLAQEIVSAGADGGWIKNLTELRNAVVHVAPVSSRQEHRLSQIRLRHLTGDKSVPTLHHPFTDAAWALPPRLPRVRNYHDEAEVKASFVAYRDFAASSGDALEYCWRTLGKLMKLAEDVRIAAGLKGERMVLTEEDLVEGAEIKIVKPGADAIKS